MVNLLATTNVHTTGINWDSVLTIIGGSVGLLSIVIGGIVRASRGFLRQQSEAITSAVNNLAASLESKLETKEKVASIAQDVAELKGKVATLGKRP